MASLKLTLQDTKTLQVICTTLVNYVDDIELKWTVEEATLNAISGDHVCMFNWVIPKVEGMYLATTNGVCGLSLKSFNKILKSFSYLKKKEKDENSPPFVFVFYEEKVVCSYRGKQHEFVLRAKDLDVSHLDPTPYEQRREIKFATEDFIAEFKISKELVADHISFKLTNARKNIVQYQTSETDDFITSNTKLQGQVLKDKDFSRNMDFYFKFKNFYLFLNIVALNDYVKVTFNVNGPLIFLVDVPDDLGTITFFIAPMENDKDVVNPGKEEEEEVVVVKKVVPVKKKTKIN